MVAQERELRTAGSDKIFREQVWSMAERQQLALALVYVREGDKLSVTQLNRLARSVGDLLAIVARLETKRVGLRVLSMSGTQPLDTATSTGRLMLAIIGAVGQAERQTMLERQRDGIAQAKRAGRYKGRVPTVRRQAALTASMAVETGSNPDSGHGHRGEFLNNDMQRPARQPCLTRFDVAISLLTGASQQATLTTPTQPDLGYS